MMPRKQGVGRIRKKGRQGGDAKGKRAVPKAEDDETVPPADGAVAPTRTDDEIIEELTSGALDRWMISYLDFEILDVLLWREAELYAWQYSAIEADREYTEAAHKKIAQQQPVFDNDTVSSAQAHETSCLELLRASTDRATELEDKKEEWGWIEGLDVDYVDIELGFA